MECVHDHFKGYKGMDLFYRYWSSGKHQASIITIHGLGSHSERFQNVANYLVPKGYSFYALDLRGHGCSSGQRAFINEWAEYREDLRSFMKIVREHEGKTPLFLIGHSLGGLIALEYVMQEPFGIDGVVAICPALMEADLEKVVVNTPKNIRNETSEQYKSNFKVLTLDPVILAELEKDPLQHQIRTIGLARGMLEVIKWVMNRTHRLQVPLLMMQGLKDRIVSPEITQTFYDKVLLDDKKWIEYPDMFHSPHDDIQRDRVFSDLYAWLREHSESLDKDK